MEQESSKKPVGIIIATVILAIGLITLVYMYYSQKNRMHDMEMTLTQEKDSLAGELRTMVKESNSLRTNNDTLNVTLTREKDKIVKLLSINATNSQLIKRYKSEISTMREIMKSYIIQIDSLNTRNKVLTAENSEVHQQISEERNTNARLSKVKEELSPKLISLL